MAFRGFCIWTLHIYIYIYIIHVQYYLYHYIFYAWHVYNNRPTRAGILTRTLINTRANTQAHSISRQLLNKHDTVQRERERERDCYFKHLTWTSTNSRWIFPTGLFCLSMSSDRRWWTQVNSLHFIIHTVRIFTHGNSFTHSA